MYGFSTNQYNYAAFFPETQKWVDIRPDAYPLLLKKVPPVDGMYILDNVMMDGLNMMGLRVPDRIPKGYIAFLTPAYRAREMGARCLQDLQCRTVGVTDLTAWLVLSAIQYAYRILPENVRVTWIPHREFYAKRDSVDLVCTTIIPGSRHAGMIQRSGMGMLGFREGMNWERMRVFLPSLAYTKNLDLLRTFGNGLFYPSRFADTIEVTSFVSVRGTEARAEGAGTGPLVARETFAIQLERPALDNDNEGYQYRCLGDPFARSQLECEHPYDLLGKPRTMPTYWDAPCRENSNCPFWTPSRGRGGCAAPDRGIGPGLCEMPAGVERQGFRKYNRDVQPFCRKCHPLDSGCVCPKGVYIFAGDSLRGVLEQNITPKQR